jgi:hypothetical protein
MFIVVFSLLGLFLSAPTTSPLNCDMECGETLLSLNAAHQFREYGIEHGLLENLGTREKPSIYTHNVNIGTLTFVGLEALGVSDHYKFLLPLSVYGLGLAYVFLTVRRISGNEQLALVTLLLFATTYWGLGAYAFNALRSWHLLAFFSIIFHTCGIARYPRSGREIAGVFLGAAAAFGCGYDFWIICAAVALFVGLANLETYTLKRVALIAITLTAAFALPFVLRQIHVAWAMGLPFWAQDFIYSFAIKVPYAHNFIEIPSLDRIDAYYREHQVLRPPAQPGNTAAQIFFTFRHMITFVTVPRWGLITLLTLAGVLIITVTPRIRKTRLATYSASLIVPAVTGIAIGLIIFAPFSLHVYIKHEFPLLVFPLLLAKGAVIHFLLSIVLAKAGIWKLRVAASFLAILIFDTAMVHWNNTTYGPALNLGWGKFFAERPNDKIALSVYNLIPTAEPLIGIAHDRAVYLSPDTMLSDRSDLQYWIYQPRERFVDFDSAVPLCNWTGWFRQLIGRHPRINPGLNCIYKQPLPKNAVRERSVSEMIDASAKRYSVVEVDQSTNGYVILRLKQDSQPIKWER